MYIRVCTRMYVLEMSTGRAGPGRGPLGPRAERAETGRINF